MTLRPLSRLVLLALLPALLFPVPDGGAAADKNPPASGSAKEGTVRLLAEVTTIDIAKSRFFVRESPKIEKSKELAICWDDFTKFMLGGEGIAATSADLAVGDSVKVAYIVTPDGRNLAQTVWIIKGKPSATSGRSFPVVRPAPPGPAAG